MQYVVVVVNEHRNLSTRRILPMKRMLKKLTAIALAGAMALSLSVTALATTAEPTAEVDAHGEVEGDVFAPLQVPADVFTIKMPTEASLADVFNLYFDPHNLIRESNNALNTGAGTGETITGEAFADDTLVYFKNASESAPSFSKTSDSIEIINKSSTPVNVQMETTWTKHTGDKYTLSSDAADFAKANADGKAALSLVLKDSKDNSAYVVEKDKSAPVIKWEAQEDKDGTNGAASTDVTAAKATIKSLIKDIKFAYTSNADAQDRQNINLGETGKTPTQWVFSIVPGAKKTPTVKISTFSLPKYKSTNGTAVTETEYKAVDSTSVTISEYKNADSTYTYSLPANTPNANGVIKINRGNVEVANITIEWDYEALGALNKAEGGTNYVTEIAKVDKTNPAPTDNSKVELKITAEAGEGALLKTGLNTVEGAYELTNDSGNLARTMTTEFDSDETKFQKLSFNLTAAITDSAKAIEDWDTAFAQSTDTKLTINWAVTAADEVDPSAEVTTALDSSTTSATLKVDWGYGAKLTDGITAASFKDSSGATRALQVDSMIQIDETDNTVVTINPGQALNSLTGGDGVVTFTFANSSTGYTKDVAVSLKADET